MSAPVDLRPADFTPLATPALGRVLAARLRQIEQHGHTAAADDAAARKIDRPEASLLYQVLRHREESEALRQAAAETCLNPEAALPILGRAWMPYREPLPLSAGVGTAVLGEPRNGLDIAAEFGVPRANDSDRDEHANWGWPMLDIEQWETPIPARGAQGFWTWPTLEGAGL